MGTYYTDGATKQDIIKECTTSWDRMPVAKGTCLAKRCMGNELWSVWEQFSNGETKRFITLYLLSKYDGSWGYKPIDEEMGPSYYKCPLKYLDMVSDHVNEVWREGVREYWESIDTYKNLKPGVEVILQDCLVKEMTIKFKHGSSWVGLADDGQHYRIKSRHIKEVVTKELVTT